MPEAVWQRLEAALRAESDARTSIGQAASPATVIDLAPRRRRPTLLSGMIAAAVVLVAAGLAIPVLRDSGSDPEVVVAAEAAKSMPVTSAGAAAPEVATAQPDAAALSAAAPDAGGPARQVVSSGIDYSAETMPTDVQQVVDTIGASNARLMSDVRPDSSMTEGTDGFTSSLPMLKTCLEWLTGADNIQALFVDRARFEGVPAAVVVVPKERARSILETLEVWVVTLDCAQTETSILGHEMVSIAPN